MFKYFITSAAKASSASKNAGFILISIIWIAGLLAVVATSFTLAVRSHSLANLNSFYNGRAESVADGMANGTAYRLATENDLAKFPELNGKAFHCRWPDEVSVSVAIQDQAGLVDINTASPMLLSALLQGLGVGDAKAAAILSSLQDFRDADTVAASGGDEPQAYHGKSYGPKNEPFAIPEELDQIPDIDDELFHKLMPLVTVSSQQEGIDLTRAPKQLLDVLGVADINNPAAQQFSSPSSSRVFGIDVIAELKNGSRFRRQALVTLLRQPERPFAILAWQRGGDVGELTPVFSAPPCFN